MCINYQNNTKNIDNIIQQGPPQNFANKILITLIEKVSPKIVTNRVTTFFGDIRTNNSH